MAEHDEDLVALIDGELQDPRKSELLARLKSDPVLRQRYEAMRETGAPIGAALGLALDRAPLDRLRAFLPTEPATQAPAPPSARGFRGLALRELAAGVVIGFLAAAALAWFAFGGMDRSEDDWRSAVVEYMELYTNETFAFPAPDASTQSRELATVGARVGAALTPETVALPGLAFKAAFSLGYDGAPLAEIDYVDPSGEPTLLCILAKGAANAPLNLERRGEYALATWTREGRQFLVIGRRQEARIADFARALESRL
jgi:anti-sigma factor RsiW